MVRRSGMRGMQSPTTREVITVYITKADLCTAAVCGSAKSCNCQLGDPLSWREVGD